MDGCRFWWNHWGWVGEKTCNPMVMHLSVLVTLIATMTFHTLFLIPCLADGDSLMCGIVMMGRQIAMMFSTFSLWGSLFQAHDLHQCSWELTSSSSMIGRTVARQLLNSSLCHLLEVSAIHQHLVSQGASIQSFEVIVYLEIQFIYKNEPLHAGGHR